MALEARNLYSQGCCPGNTYFPRMSSQFENIHLLVSFLETLRSPVPAKRLMKEFEWSRPTLFRAIQAAKAENHNITCERGMGYRLVPQEDRQGTEGFTPKELESLAVVWQMLENTQNEWVGQYADMRSTILQRLRNMGVPVEQWEGRVRYLPQHRRRTPAGVFRKVSHALLHRKVLKFQFSKADKAPETREVHPQQLVLYRNGWSLDALDESRIGMRGPDDRGIRQFALDLLSNVREVKKDWKEVPREVLKAEMASGYGLFAGKADATAKIRFSNAAAFYVAREVWHTNQTLDHKRNGTLLMQIPYVSQHPEELLGDILRWGENAEVVGPIRLKQLWKEKIQKMMQLSHEMR